MIRHVLGVFAMAAFMFMAPAQAALVITGVVDGDNEGGLPKGIELYATTFEPDLAIYSVARFTNGGPDISQVTQLPSQSLGEGEFFYITGTSGSDDYFGDAGLTVDMSNQAIANINGDDVLSVVSAANNAVAFDTFGRPGQGDTNFYQDSIAYRINSSIFGDPDGSPDAADNFSIVPYGDNDELFASTFGTFSPTAIPEPGSMLVLTAVALLVAGRRLRNRRCDRQTQEAGGLFPH